MAIPPPGSGDGQPARDLKNSILKIRKTANDFIRPFSA
jgi:hypothetical protein